MNNILDTGNTEGLVSSTIKKSVLSTITRDSSFTISDIVKSTGYSSTTVSKYISRLTEGGIITQLGRADSHTKGRKTVLYGIHPDYCYFMGIDIRNFCLSIALMNIKGEIISKQSFTDFKLENTYEVFEEICQKTEKFISSQDMNRSRIVAANFNISGRVNSKKGTSATLFNFEEMSGTTLADKLTEYIGIKSFIENDTKAMAYGEYKSGLYSKYQNMIFVNIGWGIGLGIIADGKLMNGKDGYSGEFGHICIYNNNRLCHCGKKGCIETEISGRAIVRNLTERIKNGETSILSPFVKSGSTITTEDIIHALRKQDALCIDIFSKTGLELGKHLAGIINLFNPEVLVIGGTIAQAESYYFSQYIELAIKQYALKLMYQDVPVLTSSVGPDAAITGACLLARSRFFDTEI